jgi:lysophospholipase L1-like esterase
MKIQPDSKLVMIGDSITDCGRARPIGETYADGLGNGYVNLINAWLGATDPRLRIRVINMGIGGKPTRDLAARWQSDVLDLRPDWLSIFIGINDVWRQFDTRLQTEWQVPLDEYAAILDDLIRATQPQLKGLVLMTPYFIEPNRADTMRASMDAYGAVVRRLAEKYQTILVDTQAAFDAILTHVHPMTLALDRVHPNLTGHMLLARAFLKAVEYIE